MAEIQVAVFQNGNGENQARLEFPRIDNEHLGIADDERTDDEARSQYVDELKKRAIDASNGYSHSIRLRLAKEIQLRKYQGSEREFQRCIKELHLSAMADQKFACEILEELETKPSLQTLKQKFGINYDDHQLSSAKELRQWIARDESLQLSDIEVWATELEEEAATTQLFVEEKIPLKYWQSCSETTLGFSSEETSGDSSTTTSKLNEILNKEIETAKSEMRACLGVVFTKDTIARNMSIEVHDLHVLARRARGQPICDGTVSEQLREDFAGALTAIATSGIGRNCIFKAISIALTNYSTDKFDAELRERSLKSLVQKCYLHLEEFPHKMKEVALEKIFRSMRYCSPFYCRFLSEVSGVCDRSIHVLLRQTMDSKWTYAAFGEATNEVMPVNLVATKQGKSSLFHVNAILRTDDHNGALIDCTSVTFEPDAEFGGLDSGESNKDAGVPTQDTYSFNWESYQMALKKFANGENSEDSTEPMSIFGTDTSIMREEYERLQRIRRSTRDENIADQLAVVSGHLLKETNRLENLLGKSSPKSNEELDDVVSLLIWDRKQNKFGAIYDKQDSMPWRKFIKCASTIKARVAETAQSMIDDLGFAEVVEFSRIICLWKHVFAPYSEFSRLCLSHYCVLVICKSAELVNQNSIQWKATNELVDNGYRGNELNQAIHYFDTTVRQLCVDECSLRKIQVRTIVSGPSGYEVQEKLCTLSECYRTDLPADSDLASPLHEESWLSLAVESKLHMRFLRASWPFFKLTKRTFHSLLDWSKIPIVQSENEELRDDHVNQLFDTIAFVSHPDNKAVENLSGPKSYQHVKQITFPDLLTALAACRSSVAGTQLTYRKLVTFAFYANKDGLLDCRSLQTFMRHAKLRGFDAEDGETEVKSLLQRLQKRFSTHTTLELGSLSLNASQFILASDSLPQCWMEIGDSIGHFLQPGK